MKTAPDNASRHPLAVNWTSRPRPLVPAAVTARGNAAIALGKRLLARDDASLARLSGVHGEGLLLLMGEEQDLPWIDGASYLGKDPVAPGMFVPTAEEPSVPMALLLRAVQASFPTLVPPFAMLRGESGPILIPLILARPIVRDELKRWLKKHS